MPELGTPNVKDTTKVKRKKASLPTKKPMNAHGSWLTNRYIVNNYILLEDIGSGSFGEVKLCKKAMSATKATTPAHRQLYAMKIIKRSLLLRQNRYDVLAQRRSQIDHKDVKRKSSQEKENRVLGRLKEEVEIMKRLNHPHIIKLFETNL